MSIIGQNIGHLTFWEDAKCLINWYLKYNKMYSGNNCKIEKQTITMKRIFRETVMMTVAVLLMAAVPGQQRLAAQEAGDGVLQKVGNEPGEQAGEPGSGCENESCEVPESGMGRAGGKQGGVMQLTLEGAMDLACSQSVDAAVALNQLKSAYWQFRTYKAERLPELIFSGTLPTFNNNYNSYQNADGTYSYVRSNWLGLTGELSVTQNIPFTGGTVSLSTGLDMTRQLGANAYNERCAMPSPGRPTPRIWRRSR